MMNSLVWENVGYVYAPGVDTAYALEAWLEFEFGNNVQPNWLEPPKETGFVGQFTVPEHSEKYGVYRDVHRVSIHRWIGGAS